mmetsp:Transcript_77292/g.153442  ORF Transcript_77292/g.153442 Transcript_77292/m.153442 type:complete len:101 (-) Transcript_77292:632-934(-)
MGCPTDVHMQPTLGYFSPVVAVWVGWAVLRRIAGLGLLFVGNLPLAFPGLPALTTWLAAPAMVGVGTGRMRWVADGPCHLCARSAHSGEVGSQHDYVLWY